MLLDKLYNIKIAVKYVVSSLRKNLFYIWCLIYMSGVFEYLYIQPSIHPFTHHL